MTKLTLILNSKTETHPMKGFVRCTFLKTQEPRTPAMGYELDEFGILDVMIPAAEAAELQVGEGYEITLGAALGLRVVDDSPRESAHIHVLGGA